VTVKPESQIVIQMSRPVAFGVRKHSGGGGVSVAIPASEQEDRERLTLQLLPHDGDDLPPDELRVMVALDFRRRAHAMFRSGF
jgi:hypothetical protein